MVCDVAFGGDDIAKEGFGAWIGSPWVDTVTPETRSKIQSLLADAAAGEPSRWRQVNHLSTHGEPTPVLYAAITLGEDGRVVAVGRDLRAIASLQQRLVEAQRSMERDYGRLRQAETRYRLLFQLASEAVLIVNDATGRVVEANPAAIDALGGSSKKPIGRSFFDLFDGEDRSALQTMLATVRAIGRAEPATARLRDGSSTMTVSASLFRQETGALFLARLTQVGEEGGGLSLRRSTSFVQVVESAPEALVVTDLGGAILTSNAAFLELAQLTSDEQARGQPLDRWLGRPGVDVGVILSSLREHGSLRLFSTVLRGDLGGVTEVELSAVSVAHGDPPCLGFMIRNVEPRPKPKNPEAMALPKSVEQLTELVGRVPLKDIVRETTDVIERLCIEAALELTGDNRASAAEMLGLSRQSLYVKLRRYGLGDLDPEGEA